MRMPALAAVLAAFALSPARLSPSQPLTLKSPDGRLELEFSLNAQGAPRYSAKLSGQAVLAESKLGLIRDDADFSKGLKLLSADPVEAVSDDYELRTSKRYVNHYKANKQVFHLQTAKAKKMDIIFQLSDDGLAFRYFFPGKGKKTYRIKEELSSFKFLPGSKAWLQPMQVAKTGWSKVNPCYEEYYEKEIEVGKPSTLGAGWVYPALFRTGETWMLVSETGLGRNYCASRLRSESPEGEYSVGFPDPREDFMKGPVNPESGLPWLTPWRLVALGSLKTVVESSLGTDLAPAPAEKSVHGLPGKVSWSWPILGDESCNYDTQKLFIDYAAEMGWQYTLVDAQWDKQIGYEKVKELTDYAKSKGVGILLWYNSAGDWNETYQSPRDKMLAREGRKAEFERLKAMGIAGLKIDFFNGDGQSVIGYYLDILEESNPYGLLINFHGATLPRGWQRTYPNLMTAEAVLGMEYTIFGQEHDDKQPSHAAMLPFTRNVFDPMDYTPMVLDTNKKFIRKTTSAFELALSVLFTSGLQHYAEIPDGLAKAPDYVQELLKRLPSYWGDVRFLEGYPGKYVALARQERERWYVAGINGENTEKALSLDLSSLGEIGKGFLISDGKKGNLSFKKQELRFDKEKKLDLKMAPHGGFVLVLE